MALALVTSLIHSKLSICCPKDTCRFFTKLTIRSFASGGKYLLTYISPTASDKAELVVSNARFQRGRIDFYDTNWKPLDKKDFIVLPDNRDFLSDDGKFNGDANEMIRRVDIPLMRYDFCEGNDNLQITYTIDEYMPEEMYKQIKPYLRDSSLEYVWDGNHFKKEK